MESNVVLLVIAAIVFAGLWCNEVMKVRRLKIDLDAQKNISLFPAPVVYRSKYKFIKLENAGDNTTLNNTASTYLAAGYNLDREKSTDQLLVFVKREEVKGKFKD